MTADPLDLGAIADEEMLAAGLGVPIDDGSGAALLDALVVFLCRFVVFPSVHHARAVALWVVHTYAIDATDVTPRLHIASPEPRCGKSRLVDLLELLVFAPLVVVNISEAALFRTLKEATRTLLHDEIDALFKMRNEREDLRALLNAGHARGRTVSRMVPKGRGFEMMEFPCFAATCLAGIGDLPRTIADRSIPIRLARRLPAETVERFRRRAVLPEAAALRDRLAAWAEANGKHLVEVWPDLPPALNDRAADGWEPLFAIADQAGGDWPKWARAAAVALHGSAAGDDGTAGVQLLAALRNVFDDRGESHGLWTREELLPAVNALDDAPFGAWNNGRGITAHELGRILRQFDVVPLTVRKGDRRLKGYLRRKLEPAWERYLNASVPPDPQKETGHVTTPTGQGLEAIFEAVGSPSENGSEPLWNGACHVVTDENADQEGRADSEGPGGPASDRRRNQWSS